MLVVPVRRRTLIAVERRLAMTRGAFPVRTHERSSSYTTSRTQCNWFSMPQWPWTQAAICNGDASCEGMEVMM